MWAFHRVAVATFALGACSFHTTPGGGGASPSDGATAADAPNADAQPADASIDAAVYFASCAELAAGAAGTDVTLYLDHDPGKPYAAHCGPTLQTYLVLGAPSMSSYPTGQCASLVTGQNKAVTTTWTMVHFDPTTRTVDTGDYFGATSTGGTHEDSGNGMFHYDYVHIPFGSGRTCSTSQRTLATIDLTHTNFAIASTQAWAADGFMANVGLQFDGAHKSLSLDVGGFPVGASPCRPNADYYTQSGGPCLVLDYAP
jgi:hypothetical protein